MNYSVLQVRVKRGRSTMGKWLASERKAISKLKQSMSPTSEAAESCFSKKKKKGEKIPLIYTFKSLESLEKHLVFDLH